jgi:hypothetical protein
VKAVGLWLKPHLGVVLLLVVYLIVAIAHSWVIPLSKGPDEYDNFLYIQFIATHRRFPITVAERKDVGVKADWPPAYHLLVAALTAGIDYTAPPKLKLSGDAPQYQLVDLVLPRGATVIRTEDERWPLYGVYLAWFMGRWLTIVFGVGIVTLTYLIALQIQPDNYALAFGAASLLAFMPRFQYINAVLSDDPLQGLLVTFYLLWLVLWVKKSHSLWIPIALGVTLGLAMMVKYSAGFAPVGVLLVGLMAKQRHGWGWGTYIKQITAIGVCSIVAALWWPLWVWRYFNRVAELGWISGLITPLVPGAFTDDNPTMDRVFKLLTAGTAGNIAGVSNSPYSYWDWLAHNFETFWDVTIFGAPPNYPHSMLLWIMAILGGLALVGVIKLYRRPEQRFWINIMALHALLFIPISLISFTLSGRVNDAAQGRQILFPAGVSIAILLVWGWQELIPIRRQALLSSLIAATMFLWSLLNLNYLWQEFPSPLPVRTAAWATTGLNHPLDIQFDDTLRLTGYQAELLYSASVLKIELMWHSLAQATEDYRTEITLADSQNRLQLQWVSQPAEGRFPVRAWQPGDMVRDTLYIPLAGVPAGEYKAQLRLLGRDDEPFSKKVLLTKMILNHIPPADRIAIWRQGRPVSQTAPGNSNLQSPHLPISNLLIPPSLPTFRYRSSIPVTAPRAAEMVLIGSNDRRYTPAAGIGSLRVFMVSYDWPSGEYQLQVDNAASGLKLAVENFDQGRRRAWNFNPPAMMYPVQANFADKIELLGYDLPPAGRRVEAGGGIPLILYWRSLAQMNEDYTMFVQLLDANQQRRGGYDRFAREDYNTTLWVPGEVVDDGFAVPVNNDAPDGIYTIRVGWYRQMDGQSAEVLSLVRDNQVIDETSVVIGPIKVGGPPPEVIAANPIPHIPLNQSFGDQISLLGYDLTDENGQFFETQNSAKGTQAKLKIHNSQFKILNLKLYWQGLTQINNDYTVFAHLRDETNQTVAQVDGPPAAGQYPTSLWDAGETILDAFTLNLSPELGPGRYRLVVGLYDPVTGMRLAAPDSMDNSAALLEIEVE